MRVFDVRSAPRSNNPGREGRPPEEQRADPRAAPGSLSAMSSVSLGSAQYLLCEPAGESLAFDVEQAEKGAGAAPGADGLCRRTGSVQIAVRGVGYALPSRKRFGCCRRGGGDAGSREKVHLLSGVTGVVCPGRLLAILGPSGAGKTTFLNLLGGHLKPSKGEILLNGERAAPGDICDLSAFVHQDDCMLATLTVRETVLFAANLRLPAAMPAQEKVSRAMSAIQWLGLEGCQDTRIGEGSSGRRGVSGGERKRCAIASQLLTNPSLIFLDEPSSGLDAYAAYNLGSILKSLCHANGMTILMTIHQPSSDLYDLFDDMLLLARGRTVFWAPAKTAVEYFGEMGHACPQYCNPCDYIFLHVLGKGGGEAKLQRSDSGAALALQDAWEQSSFHAEVEETFEQRLHSHGISKLLAVQYQASAPWLRKVGMLTRRGYRNLGRNRMLLPARLVQALVTSLIAIAVFWDVSDNQTGIMARSGVLFYFAASAMFSSVVQSLSAFGSEREVFLTEHANGAYPVTAYFVSKLAVELPFQAAVPVVMSLSAYWAIGLQEDARHWLIFTLALVLVHLCGGCLGLTLTSAFRDISVALSLSPLLVLPLMLFSGFFISYEDTPVYVKWVQAISPVRWAFATMMQNEFQGLELHCTESQMLKTDNGAGEVCPIPLGDIYIQLYGFDVVAICQCMVVLAVLFFAFALLSFISLYVSTLAASCRGVMPQGACGGWRK